MTRSDGGASRVAGEWIFSASIMQCEAAVFGRIHLTENGEMVYLASGEDLIGRGVGRWVTEGPVIGFQVDIFQYTPTSVKHTHGEPHRFRGVARVPNDSGTWAGEWYFCPYNMPPRAVGIFRAIRRVAGQPPPSNVKTPPEVPEMAKKAVIGKLDKLLEPLPLSEARWKPHIQTGNPQQVIYIRNWLETAQVKEFERTIERTCDWERMQTRDTQEFGSSTRCPCGRGLLREELPQWQMNVITALHNLGVFHPVLYPANSVRLNAYTPGQGIHPHLDGPVYFPRAAIVSLGSHCIFDFYPRYDLDEDERGFSWDRDKEVPAGPDMPPALKPSMSLLLEPGSLLVFSGDAFIHHRHGISAVESDEIGPQVRNAKDIGLSVGDTLNRGRRVSLTIRHLLPRCMCSGM